MGREWKEHYRVEYADHWLVRSAHIANDPVLQRYYRALRQLMRASPGEAVLECASGTGRPLAASTAAVGAQVIGVDLSERLVAEARRNFQEDRLRGSFAVADAERLPFPSASFDLVYCINATWYFPTLGALLEEMFRVTRANGRVVFDCINLCHPGQFLNFMFQLFVRTRLATLLRTARRWVRGGPRGQPVPSWGRWSARTPWAVGREVRRLGVIQEVRGYFVLVPIGLPILGERGNLSRRFPQLSFGLADTPVLKWFGAKLVFVCQKGVADS